MRKPSLRSVAALALLLAACSYSWTYEVQVQVADEVTLSADVPVIMLATEGAGEIDEATEVASEVTVDGQRSYSGSGTTCCAPTADVSLFAFLDLDGSGRWETGEPWGADPNNPITIENDDYVGTIVIANDPAAP